MKKLLLFALLFVNISNAQTQIGHDIALNSNDIYWTALSENGNTVAVGTGTVTQIFSNVSGSWVQVGQDIQGHGYRIMLSNNGSVVAVTNYANTVKVYENINNNWTQIGQDISQRAHDIALSGDGSVLAMADDSGPVNIYRNISGTWTPIGNLNVDSGFSICLSENGDTIAVAPHPGYSIGVFKNVNNSWIQVGNTILTDQNNGLTGYRMDISSDGTTIVMQKSTTQTQNYGSVNIYKYDNNTWSLRGNTIVSQEANDNFGRNVAISGSGNVVLVSARGYGPNSHKSRVEIHEYLQGNWIKKGEVRDNNDNDIDWAIALSRDGNTFAIKKNENSGPKPASNILDNQTNTDNNQAKGASSAINVYDISGILSSDKFVLENFNIYPNPTADILNIELKENLILEKVLIYNTNGRLVKETSEKMINVSGLAKGIYNVQVITSKGKATQKVVVK